MRIGPVQLLVVGFDRPDSGDGVVAELEHLRETDAVQVIDLLVVHRNAVGAVERVRRFNTGTKYAGAIVGRLIGLGADRVEGEDPLPVAEECWSLDDVIANDSTAVIALIEHRWAIGARAAISSAKGALVADAWIHPADLAAAGLTDTEEGDPAAARPSGPPSSMPSA